MWSQTRLLTCSSVTNLAKSALLKGLAPTPSITRHMLSRNFFLSSVDAHSSCCSHTSSLSPKTIVGSRKISVFNPLCSEEKEATEEEPGTENEEKEKENQSAKKTGPVARHLDKDRSKVIPVETSIRYLNSSAYREAYGDQPVWALYRRNFPGQFAPKNTRKTCIRNQRLTSGNPCPICRDIYLVVDYRNTDLLKQFISPHTGAVIHWDKTGVCRTQQERLLIEIERAKDIGTITFDVIFREYDYSEYEKIYASY